MVFFKNSKLTFNIEKEDFSKGVYDMDVSCRGCLINL